jgi:hypothetical protein
LLRDIPVKANQNSFINVGSIMSNDAKERIIFNNGKVIDQGPIRRGGQKVFPFNKGDYLAFLKNNFGSLAVYSLSDGIVLQGDGVNFTIGIKPTAKNTKAGAKIKVKLLLVGMHRLVKDPTKLAAKICSDYGISGNPSYLVNCDNGKIISQRYRLDLGAGEDSCFTGSVSNIKNFPGNLGCALYSMNDNWTAFFRQENKNGAKTRVIPVEKGIAYFILRDEDDGCKIFAGHPVISDNPELVLNVSRSEDWKNWVLEIHNPTNKSISANVRNSKHIKGIVFNEKINISAGSSQFRNLGPAND